MGGPGPDSGRTDLGRAIEPVADCRQFERQFKALQFQSDLSCRFLSEKRKPVDTNPSYGVTVTSEVRAGADYGWSSSGEACVTADGQEYCTM